MRTAYARVVVDGLEPAILTAGALLGRLPRADLRIDDARISEAHALLSLREGRLELLALRGELRCQGMRSARIRLVAGEVIELAEGLRLRVLEVDLPDEVLAVAGLGPEPIPLTGTVYSVVRGTLVPRHVPDASARLWATNESWTLELPTGERRPVDVGAALPDGLTLVSVPLSAGDAQETHIGAQRAIRFACRYDSVHVSADGAPPLVLTGYPARILSDALTIQKPLFWEALATELWPEDADDRASLRAHWDKAMHTLRRKLRAVGLRTDVLRSDGKGLFEGLLLPGDVVVDET